MTTEARLRTALERIANSEIPGVSGGPHGPSAQVMEFAAKALASASECPVCGGRGWHTAGGNDPAACGRCPAGEAWSERDDARAEGTRWAENATKAQARANALEPIVRHVAGLVAPEAGAEYGEVHRELIYQARRVLSDG